ncbi:hypothetical protein G7017_03935 [Pseudomonas fulva]|uniref:hypothetical protein n=1 Tax=Pseudomonas fulva TaxID=47880 RepID=UPI0015E3C861|nr:hypothetical protein [Pseudomonas fulva]MBA1220054.1 hypothetical protein [Pseudomonas fulva]
MTTEVKVTYTTDGNGDETVMSVNSPYNKSFIERARKLHGKFNTTTKAWDFSPKIKVKVFDALRTVYDYEEPGVVVEKVDILVTINEKVFGFTGDVILGGRIIAVGKERDSGAYEGKDVNMVKGEMSTGGSRKNWYTYIDAGTILEVFNVNKKTLKLWDKEEAVSYKIIENK